MLGRQKSILKYAAGKTITRGLFIWKSPPGLNRREREKTEISHVNRLKNSNVELYFLSPRTRTYQIKFCILVLGLQLLEAKPEYHPCFINLSSYLEPNTDCGVPKLGTTRMHEHFPWSATGRLSVTRNYANETRGRFPLQTYALTSCADE